MREYSKCVNMRNDPTESVGTSARKLKLSDNARNIEVDASFGYRFINFLAVLSARKEEEELNVNLEGQLYCAGIAD